MPRLRLKKGDQVIYVGPKHSVLVKDEIYCVDTANDTHARVVTNTGFAGVSLKYFRIA